MGRKSEPLPTVIVRAGERESKRSNSFLLMLFAPAILVNSGRPPASGRTVLTAGDVFLVLASPLSGPALNKNKKEPIMSPGLDSAVGLLFAASDVSSWTDKEMLTAIGSTVALVVPVCLFVMRHAVTNARRAAKKANQEKNSLQKQISELEKKIEQLLQPSEGEMPRIRDLQEGMQELRRHFDGFLKEKEANQADAANARMLAEELGRNLDSLQVKLQQYEGELAIEQRRIKKALGKDGQTWMERVLHSAPEFKPLAPDGRRIPIISVLNLKGGVGKTTTTANLGAALDSLGYRVLLLDLDL